MKVVLVAVNSRYTQVNLALGYLRAHLKSSGYASSLLEFSINEPTQEILSRIYRQNPTWLCFSVYIWNAEIIAKLLPIVHQILPKAKIVLGGAEVSNNSSFWLHNFPYIAHLVKGEGEIALPALFVGQNLPQLVEIPHPFEATLFPYEDYFPQAGKKYFYYESSRGCLYNCSYCLSHQQSLQFKSLEKVFAELISLYELKPPLIKFVDRTFNADGQRARRIWSFLGELEAAFHFELHPELLNEEDFRLFNSIPTGKFQFEIGLQSLNPKTLRAINRKMDIEKSLANIKQLISLNKFHLHLDLIAGLPYEDKDSFREGFNRVYFLGAENLQLGFLKILPGTQMASQVEEYGLKFQPYPPYEIILNNWLDFGDLCELKAVERSLGKYANSGFFLFTLRYLTKYIEPYELFLLLSEQSSYNGKNWEELAKELLSLNNSLQIADPHVLQDTLFYDWCTQATGMYYPPFLEVDFVRLKEAKKYLAGYSTRILNKMIVYQPQTSYMQKILQTADFIFFLDKKRVK